MKHSHFLFGRLVVSLLGLAAVPIAALGAAGGETMGFALHDSPQPLAVVSFQDENGAVLDLSAFRGRIVLLNVWATWCTPCRKELPSLDRLQRSLGGEDFQVVALSIDRDGADPVRRFFEEIGITSLDIFVDPTSQTLSALKVTGLPATLLIDWEGRELGRLIGPAEWDSPQMQTFIQSWLSNDAPPSTGAETEFTPPDDSE